MVKLPPKLEARLLAYARDSGIIEDALVSMAVEYMLDNLPKVVKGADDGHDECIRKGRS